MFMKGKQSRIGGNFYQSNDGPEAHTLISPADFGGAYQSSDTTQKFAGQISNGDFIVKMAIILPTGQWYAPSALINDEWYCMVLHCIAWYCMVLHGIAWYCMVLHGIA